MTNQFISLPASKKTLTVEFLVATYCVTSIWLTMMFPIFKYLTYAIPFLSLIAIIATGRITIPPNALPQCTLILGGIALAPFGNLRGLQDIWLMLMGLSPFFFGFKYKTPWKMVFIATVIATFVFLVLHRGSGQESIHFDPATSSSSFEATTSFVFGTLAVWAALEKRWRNALIALFLCILTLKRIVVLSAMLVIGLLFLPRSLVNRLLRPIPILVFNLVYIAIVIAYAHGMFDAFISNISGQTSNQLGMGRQQLFQIPVNALTSKPLNFAVYGIGAGGIYEVLKLKLLLHNDSLKILVEYGGIAWTCFFVAMYWNARFEVRAMMLFFNVLLLTDNTLIYPYVTFGISLAIQQILTAHSHEPPLADQPKEPRRYPSVVSAPATRSGIW